MKKNLNKNLWLTTVIMSTFLLIMALIPSAEYWLRIDMPFVRILPKDNAFNIFGYVTNINYIQVGIIVLATFATVMSGFLIFIGVNIISRINKINKLYSNNYIGTSGVYDHSYQKQN